MFGWALGGHWHGARGLGWGSNCKALGETLKRTMFNPPLDSRALPGIRNVGKHAKCTPWACQGQGCFSLFKRTDSFLPKQGTRSPWILQNFLPMDREEPKAQALLLEALLNSSW